MRKHLLLIVSILLFMVSITFLFIGIREYNSTAIIVGIVLLIIVNLFSIVRAFIYMRNVRKNQKS